MRARPYRELRDKFFSPEEQEHQNREAARIVAEQLTLRELRKVCGLSQEELGERLEKSQAQVSKFERGEDILLSNLRALIEALDCEIRIQVRKRDRGPWTDLSLRTAAE